MMKDFAMHISDLLENSTNAGADIVKLSIKIDKKKDKLRILIGDNGKGMNREQVNRVFDPFVTSRTVRRVGLGLPLIKQTAESCGGKVRLFSRENIGTVLYICLSYSHIDRPPMGNIIFSVLSFLRGNKNIDFYYEHDYNNHCFKISTNDIKQEIDDLDLLDQPEIYHFIEEYIQEGLTQIYGGKEDEIFS